MKKILIAVLVTAVVAFTGVVEVMAQDAHNYDAIPQFILPLEYVD